jgi:hypothetical protein
MKKLLIVVGVVLAGFLVYWFMGSSTGAEILSDSATIRTYRIDNGFTDYAFAEISFQKNVSGERYVNIFVDINKDNVLREDEWIVQNEKAMIAKDYANRFSFTRPAGLEEGQYILSAGLTTEKITTQDDIRDEDRKKFDATVEVTQIEEQFGLNVPGASPDLKRGAGLVDLVQTAQAQDYDSGISGNIPDIAGGPMDCFPIATTNNLINMTQQHGRRGDLPADPQAIITELKQDMQFNAGVVNRNFLTGKNAFVTRYNLPITTTEIRRPSKSDIEDAFTGGDAVEISTTMLRSRSGKPDTGHVLTGIGASQDGDELGIAVHDPATPVGADTFLVGQTGGATPFLMINYPLWDGIVIIDAIYIQTWNQQANGSQTGTNVAPAESSAATTGTEIKKGTNLELFKDGKAIEVIEYDDTYIPVSELRIGDAHPPHATGPGCPAKHWHADMPATAINDVAYPDPLAGGCGFGTLDERPVANYFPHELLAE